jgi:predicted metal-binding protein
MAILYKKYLICGCCITAITINDKGNLGGHKYLFVCKTCQDNYSDAELDKRLDNIYFVNYKVDDTWTKFYK